MNISDDSSCYSYMSYNLVIRNKVTNFNVYIDKSSPIVYHKFWQHFGNKKSVSQNKLCNRSKKTALSQQNLNKIV